MTETNALVLQLKFYRMPSQVHFVRHNDVRVIINLLENTFPFSKEQRDSCSKTNDLSAAKEEKIPCCKSKPL